MFLRFIGILAVSCIIHAQVTWKYNPFTKQLDMVGSGSTSITAGTGITVAGSTVSIDSAVTQTRARGQNREDNVCSDNGGDDTYVCTPTYTPAANTAGLQMSLYVTTTNTGAASLNVGPGAASIKTMAGADPADGALIVGKPNLLEFDGTNWIILGGSSGTTVTAAPPYLVIAGTSYTTDGYAITAPPTASWTANNCGSCTFTTAGLNGAIRLVGGTSNPGLYSQVRTLGATRTLIAKVALAGNANGASFSACGVGVMNAAGTKYRVLGPFANNGNTGIADISFDGGPTAFNAETAIGNGNSNTLLRIAVGANYTASISNDGGQSWQEVFTFAYNVIFGGAVSNSDYWTFTSKPNGSGYPSTCTLLSWSAS